MELENTMSCGACGEKSLPGKTFCENCGKELAQIPISKTRMFFAVLLNLLLPGGGTLLIGEKKIGAIQLSLYVLYLGFSLSGGLREIAFYLYRNFGVTNFSVSLLILPVMVWAQVTVIRKTMNRNRNPKK